MHEHHPPIPHPRLIGVRPATMQALGSFMRTAHLQRQSAARGLAKGGASFSQMAYLRLLTEEDGISQTDLAERLHVSKPTVTTSLNLMEREGLVERRPDEKDRRLTRVHLTEAGRERGDRLSAGLSSFVRETFGSLSDDDALELARLLDQVSERMRDLLDPTEGTAE